MLSSIQSTPVHGRSAARAGELFKQHQQEIYRNTDRLFVRLMFCQWVAGIVLALVISPYTWNGQTSQVHVHVWAAILIGGALTAFPIWMTRAWPGAAATRHIIAVAQMLMSALLISLTGGRIETHFHVFGSLVILSFYRDWRVLVPATLVVALDHFLRGIYFPYSVYGVLSASPWRSIEHAGWVIFEDIFLVISCLRSIREMRFIANRTAALEASEASAREIFEEAPIGMAVVNLEHRFERANGAFCHLLGYSNEELKQRTPMDVTYKDDVDLGIELPEEMLNGRRRSCIEKRYVSKSEEVLWANRTACVIRDEDGKPRHFLIMVEDISERKRAELALQESRHRLETALHTNELILQNSQDVICTTDEKGCFLTVSAACEALWGYRPEELVGTPYIDLVHPDDRVRTNKAAADIMAGSSVNDFENRYTRKDGSLVTVMWSASWSEADRMMFAVAHDITERAQIEKALVLAKDAADRANNAKSEFLSRMSHELRTPLNAILGFGQLLERQKPTEAQRSHVSYILNAGNHLLDLINEVLDISRIEAGRLQLSLEPVFVGDVVSETLDLMRPLATERSIDLSVRDESLQDHFVLADRQRLKQVLLNLLTNAVKYTPVGGSVGVSCDALQGEQTRIVVTDSGEGIPADKISRLFTPFDRLDAEQSDVQGHGLGLALSQRLMQAMGGTIDVNSTGRPRQHLLGGIARTQSPLERVAKAKKTVRSKKLAAPTDRRTVLYIEDNLSNLTLVEQILADQPEIELMTAMLGKLGLDLARQHSPDLVLLDLHLPDLPGWEVLEQLQKNEATRQIPVVILSADATARQIARLMSAGARHYLTKPLDVEQFFRVVTTTVKPAAEAAQYVPA